MNMFKTPLHPRQTFLITLLHILSLYGFQTALSSNTDWKTIVYHLLMCHMGTLGVTMGVHRLWCHRSYHANRFVQFVLLVMFTYSGEPPVYIWIRDHRIHHKYSDTDADPYNIKRGFFFSQIGWLCMKKTQEFHEKAKVVFMDDITSDPMLMFQSRYHPLLVGTVWAMSALVPTLLWNENYITSYAVLLLGILISGHHIGTVNSLTHSWGWRPYDKGIEPTLNRLVAYLSLGEGYHNFHHTFPRDYTQSELHWSQNFNVAALLINILEHIGLVHSTKRETRDLIGSRRKRTGDIDLNIRPVSSLLDWIIGSIITNWAIWLILGIRYLKTIQFEFEN